MLPIPTKLEKFLNARIDLTFFGRYIGTGQYVRMHNFTHYDWYDTDDESSSAEDWFGKFTSKKNELVGT